MLLVFCVGLLIAVSGTHARCSKSRTVNRVNKSYGPACGPNSHYDQCATACPKTCDNYNQPPYACNAGCGEGCKCNDGYVLGPNNNCIAPSQCPQCGPNSHYNSCGTDCPLTCDNYKNPPEVCDARCNPGCECDKGFVKAPSGQCVRPKQCPKKEVQSPCGPNSHYDECAGMCPKTCDNYNQTQIACNDACAAGCKCNDGFVLTKDGRCVDPNQCPAPCGPNSHYDECAGMCPRTCDNPYNQPHKVCNDACAAGCKCNDGFVLTKDGRCVDPNQCSVTCGMNEFYSNCVNPCNNCSQKGYCYNYPCYSGCDCFRGYYRNNQGRCVPEQQCPAAQ